ncbi:hypothetical protein J6590_001589 [Homalodisca vitripennis]|nr:hypothetical protein J6590_001589 [Homalodisca vitripennis]
MTCDSVVMHLQQPGLILMWGDFWSKKWLPAGHGPRREGEGDCLVWSVNIGLCKWMGSSHQGYGECRVTGLVIHLTQSLH